MPRNFTDRLDHPSPVVSIALVGPLRRSPDPERDRYAIDILHEDGATTHIELLTERGREIGLTELPF
jgi:hypothetical protein